MKRAKAITRIVYKKEPEKGDRGDRGPIPRVRNYGHGVEYLSGADGEEFIDYAFYDGLYYRCMVSHTSTEDETPFDDINHGYVNWSLETEFEFLATGVAFIGEGAEGWILDKGRIYHSSGKIELDAKGTIKTSNGNFSVDKNGNLTARSGTFAGFLKIPFVGISSGATRISAGVYRVKDKFNLATDGSYGSGYEGTLELPDDISLGGTLLSVFDFPVKTKSSTLLTIKTARNYRLLHPSKKGTLGLTGCTQMVCTRGGLVQLLAVNCSGSLYWIVVSDVMPDAVIS